MAGTPRIARCASGSGAWHRKHHPSGRRVHEVQNTVFDAATAWRERCQAITTSAWQRPQAADVLDVLDVFEVFEVFEVFACPSLATVAGPTMARAAAIGTRAALAARIAQPFSWAARLAWPAAAVRDEDVVAQHADGAGDKGRATPSCGPAQGNTMIAAGS